jgi:hypothetical protein
MVRRMRGRIILQEVSTGAYVADDGSWVESCQQAKVFEHIYLALLRGLDIRDKCLQVVWCFRNPAASMYLPVRPEDGERVRTCGECPLMGRLKR